MAIDENQTGFECDRCKNRGSKAFTSDMIGEVLLLFAVFRPELYRLYRQAEKIHDRAALVAFQEANRKGLGVIIFE